MRCRSDYSRSARRARGSLSLSHKRISQNGASTCPSFSLGLQEREPGWLGLAFQTPGSGSLGVWLSGPSVMPLLFWGPLAHRACLSPCLTLGLSEALSLVFWVPFSESVSSSPRFSLVMLTEAGRCRQRCHCLLPPRSPFPTVSVLPSSGLGEGGQGSVPSSLLRAGTCRVTSALTLTLWTLLIPTLSFQLPAPSPSVWIPSWFSGSLT